MSTDAVFLLDTGMSDEAKRLFRAMAPGNDESSRSVLDRDAAFDSLMDAYRQAGSYDWDGEGGAPANARSYEYAKLFVLRLPFWADNPEASVDPDGEISLEWDYGRWWVFSVSLGEDGTLSYAGLFGPAKQHGVETFVDDIPESVLQGIRRAARGRSRQLLT